MMKKKNLPQTSQTAEANHKYDRQFRVLRVYEDWSEDALPGGGALLLDVLEEKSGISAIGIELCTELDCSGQRQSWFCPQDGVEFDSLSGSVGSDGPTIYQELAQALERHIQRLKDFIGAA